MKRLELVFLNIIILIKQQSLFFALMIISQIVVCIGIFLGIGAIQNTQNEQKEIDVRTMYFEVYHSGVILDDTGKISYKECDNILDFERKTERVLSVIPENMLSFVKISGIVSENEPIGYNAVITAPDSFPLTQEQIENGEKCAILREESKLGDLSVGDSITLLNTEYKVVSVGDYSAEVLIPIGAADKNFLADGLRIELKEVPDRALCDEISAALNELFPESEISTPEIPDLMELQFNRTMILSSLIIIIIAVLNLSYCYSYLFIKRKRIIAAYMICGSTKSCATNIMTIECVIISLFCYLFAIGIVYPFIPIIVKIYVSSQGLYTIKFFAATGAAYLATIAMVVKTLFSIINEKSISDIRRGN